jgi:hypothetical protein
MAIEDLPNSDEDAVNILAQAGYLKAGNKNLEVSLESSNTLNIQPKGNLFGAKVRVEDDGSVTPILTFDTKKLREKKNYIPPENLVDQALKDFWENQ